jgi:hypothetical protein
MVLGWPPSKIVFGDPDFQPRYLWWPCLLPDGDEMSNLYRAPLGSYVKLSSAVTAILVGVLKLGFLTFITRFFMNFELLPILTDYAN